MQQLRSYWIKITRRQFAKHASWIFIGQGVNFFLQAGSFILLARLLGVTEFGLFVGAFAVVNTVAPYSTLGTGMLFMRYVTAKPEDAPVYWGNSLITTFIISIAFAGASVWVGPALTGIRSPFLFVLLVFANCLFTQVSVTAGTVSLTFKRMRMTAVLSFIANASRFLTLVFMSVTVHHATAIEWSVGVFIATGCAAAIAFVWVQKTLGKIAFSRRLILLRAREGFGFSFAGTTQNLYNDVDKIMLSHYGMNRQNGFYTLAYRVIDFSTTPISAIDRTALPRYFDLFHKNLPSFFRLAVKSMGVALILGVAVGIGTNVIAPIVPHIVGRDFSNVLQVLNILWCLPILRGIHMLSGSALTGSGRQNWRTATQIMVALLNVLLNLLWIPHYGWRGAAWSSVASDGLLGVLNIALLSWMWWELDRNKNRLAKAESVDG